jgi:hypothetical protein
MVKIPEHFLTTVLTCCSGWNVLVRDSSWMSTTRRPAENAQVCRRFAGNAGVITVLDRRRATALSFEHTILAQTRRRMGPTVRYR